MGLSTGLEANGNRGNIRDKSLSNPKLHLVFGGRVKNPQTLEFTDLEKLDIVGMFPDYASAEEAWRGAAQRTVDDAEMKYVVVHLHKLLQPEV
jgi:Domain of unknown function (DUF4170)